MAEKLSVKVYYIVNKLTEEIRKFSIDQDVAANYEYLIGKIRHVFPDLLRKDLLLFWKDDENDYISVSSDEELVQALTAVPVGTECLKLFVKEKGAVKSSENAEHPGIVCDGCDSNIRGIRFKCMSCFDYDLCSACEKKGSHPEGHEMLCIKKPRTASGTYGTYVFRFPHFHGCHRGSNWHANRKGGCAHAKCLSENPSCSKSTDEATAEKEPGQCNEEECKKLVGDIATAFGLDPEVANSSLKVFFQNITDAQGKTDSSQATSKEFKLSDMVQHMAQMFGMDPEIMISTTRVLAGNCCQPKEKCQEEREQPQQKSEEQNATEEHSSEKSFTEKATVNSSQEEKMETEQSSSKEASSNVEAIDFEKMINGFANQFNFIANTQGQSQEGEQQQSPNLGNIMQQLVQGFATTANSSESTKELETSKASSKDSEEFIVVDKKTNNDESLNKEEKFEQRLDKALRQMEAMGFDNDGGWLRQLLISKDLNIGRVLDALNPSV